MSEFERRILIVEDDAFMGSLMAGALCNEGFTARVAASALDAKRQLAAFDPDVVIVDIDLGDGPNGIDFIQVVRASRPDVVAILLSKHADSASAGLRSSQIPDGVAYLRKSLVHDTQTLVDAIEEATRGRAEEFRHDRESKGSLDLLTSVQREILHLMAQGFSNRAIAEQRGVSLSNIEQRISEIFKAFDLTANDDVVPRVEAIRRYVAISGVPERPKS